VFADIRRIGRKAIANWFWVASISYLQDDDRPGQRLNLIINMNAKTLP